MKYLQHITEHMMIPIYQYSLDGEFIKKHDCVSDAAREIGDIDKRGGIVGVAQGRRKSAYGYVWKYEHDVKIQNMSSETKNKLRDFGLGSILDELDI